MDHHYIELEVREQIGWIQFSRKEKLNALNPDVLNDLKIALKICEKEDEIRAVVLKGHTRAFIAGADIEHMAQGDINSAYQLTSLTIEVQELLANLAKPTIAAISGYALGGGCEIALCCDFRYGADNAVMGLPEINLGIIPGGGGTQRLTRLIGLGLATRLIFSGEMINAEEAEKIGLLDKIFPLEMLEQEVAAFARKMISKPAIALRAAKQAIQCGMNMSLSDGLKFEQGLFAMLFGTQDQKEGMEAFLQKREAEFQGK